MVKLVVAALLLQVIMMSVLVSAETNKVCCAESQLDTLTSQVQKVVPYLAGCPSCVSNFLNMFCNFSCSPDQSHSINVTSVTHVITLSESKSAQTTLFFSHPEVDISYDEQEKWDVTPALTLFLHVIASMVITKLMVDYDIKSKAAIAKLGKQLKENDCCA